MELGGVCELMKEVGGVGQRRQLASKCGQH